MVSVIIDRHMINLKDDSRGNIWTRSTRDKGSYSRTAPVSEKRLYFRKIKNEHDTEPKQEFVETFTLRYTAQSKLIIHRGRILPFCATDFFLIPSSAIHLVRTLSGGTVLEPAFDSIQYHR